MNAGQRSWPAVSWAHSGVRHLEATRSPPYLSQVGTPASTAQSDKPGHGPALAPDSMGRNMGLL